MKSAILYASKAAGERTTCVMAGTSATNKFSIAPAVPLFVRAELVEGDCLSALDKAKPRDGETVLNTIPIEE